MSKTLKILSMLLVVLTILAITVPAYAIDFNATIQNIKTGGDAHAKDATEVQKLGGKIVGVIQAVGTVVAIVMLLVVGITYLTKSPEGKAEYKKSMGNYIIGALLIFGAATLVNAIYHIAQGL